MAFANFANQDNTLNLRATLEQTALLSSLYRNRRDVVDLVLRLTGGGEIILFHHNPDGLPPSWLLGKTESQWLLSIAGTTTREQILRQTTGLLGEDYPYPHTRVNSFYYRQALSIEQQILPTLLADRAPRDFLVSGHSMGAGVAFVLSLLLQARYGRERIQLMTFGQPRTLSSNYGGNLPRVYVPIQHESDPVPRLPPSNINHSIYLGPLLGVLLSGQQSWQHFGQPFYINNDNQIGAGQNNEDTGSVLDLARPNFNIAEHMIEQLGERLASIYLRDVNQAPTSLYIPVVRRLLVEQQNPNFGANFRITDYINLDAINRANFPDRGNVITPENVNSAQSQNIVINSATISQEQNIGNILGAIMAAPTLWKFTFYQGDGEYGRTISFIWGQNGTEAQAETAARTLGSKLAALQGATHAANAAHIKGKGDPEYTFLKLSDALNPRNAVKLIKCGGIDWAGYAGMTDNASGEMSSALSVRLKGRTADPTESSKRKDTITIVTALGHEG